MDDVRSILTKMIPSPNKKQERDRGADAEEACMIKTGEGLQLHYSLQA